MAHLSDTQTIHTGEVDFVHTGPGTLAGRYLRMIWQPVYASEDLKPGYAAPIRIMSEDFTLYRGESGAAYIVDFRCAHRGTQLSNSWHSSWLILANKGHRRFRVIPSWKKRASSTSAAISAIATISTPWRTASIRRMCRLPMPNPI